jgi:hypothetical protein
MKTKYGNKYSEGGWTNDVQAGILGAGIGAITPMLNPDAFSTKANSLKTVSSSLMSAAPGLLSIPGAGPFLAGGAVLGGAVTGIIGNNAQKRDDSMAQAAQYRPNYMSYGGRMFAQGGTMPIEEQLTQIMAGGTHEQNPQGGVPVGQDAQGTPNLVEEGETILNSEQYVFSDRIEIEKEMAVEFALPRKFIGKTFAEASKLLAVPKGYENDPYSVSTSRKMMDRLMMSQEQVREEMEAEQGQMGQEGNQFALGGSMGEEGVELMPEASPAAPLRDTDIIDPVKKQILQALPPEYAPIAALIYQAETGTPKSYFHYYGGKELDIPSGITYGDLLKHNNWGFTELPDGTRTSALGYNQLTKTTAGRLAVKYPELKSMVWDTPETQAYITQLLLEDRGIERYLKNDMTTSEFAEGLGEEWQSLSKDHWPKYFGDLDLEETIEDFRDYGAHIAGDELLGFGDFNDIRELATVAKKAPPIDGKPAQDSENTETASDSNPDAQGSKSLESILNNAKKPTEVSTDPPKYNEDGSVNYKRGSKAGPKPAPNQTKINYTPTAEQKAMLESQGPSRAGQVEAYDGPNLAQNIVGYSTNLGTVAESIMTGEPIPGNLHYMPMEDMNPLSIPLAYGAARLGSGIYGSIAGAAKIADMLSKVPRDPNAVALGSKGRWGSRFHNPHNPTPAMQNNMMRNVGFGTVRGYDEGMNSPFPQVPIPRLGPTSGNNSGEFKLTADQIKDIKSKLQENAAEVKNAEGAINQEFDYPDAERSYSSDEYANILQKPSAGPITPKIPQRPKDLLLGSENLPPDDRWANGRHLARFAPVAANLANMISTGISGPETVSPYLTNNRYEFNPVDMRHVEEMLRTEQRGLQNRLQNTRGNMGQSQQMMMSSSMPYFSALSEARLKATMANNELLNRKSQFEYQQAAANNQAKFVTDDLNAKNRGAYDNAMRAYLAAIGENIGGIGRENWMMEQANKIPGGGTQPAYDLRADLFRTFGKK